MIRFLPGLLSSRVLSELLRSSLLWLGERQRLRPVGQHDLLRDAHLVRRRRRTGTSASGNYYNYRTGTTGSYRRPPVQRLHRQCDPRLRPYRQHGSGRLGRRRARQQLQHVHRSAIDRQRRLRNGRRWQHLQPGGRIHGGTARRCARRRRIDLQRAHRRDQHLGHGVGGQQSLRGRQRQRLQEHRRRLAAALVEWLEQCWRQLVVGPGIAGAQHRGRPLWRLQQQPIRPLWWRWGLRRRR